MHVSAVSTQYIVEATPEPPVSAGVKVISRSAFCHPEGASSVVVGAVVSHVNDISSYAVFPILSVTVSLIVYTPSVSASIVVSSVLSLPKVIVPGPACFVHA